MRKTLALFLVVASCICLQAGDLSQKNVPAPVLEYVSLHFPDAKRVKWDYDKDDNLYEADFKISGFDHELKIASDGTMIRSEIEIREKTLPQNIREYIITKHPKAKIDTAKVVVSKESIIYKVKIAEGSFFSKKYRTLSLDPQNLSN